jgi:hypothetical protein
VIANGVPGALDSDRREGHSNIQASLFPHLYSGRFQTLADAHGCVVCEASPNGKSTT